MGEWIFDDGKSVYSSWFKLRSVMLFPDEPKRQKMAYDYLFYRYVIERRKIEEFSFEVPYKKAAIGLANIVGKLKFLNKIHDRMHSSTVAGIIGRLVFSLAYHEFPEPSINKATELYSYRFKDKGKNTRKEGKKFKYNIGVTYAKQCHDIHRDVLPFCVAHSLCKPSQANSLIEFEERVDIFLSLAEGFADYCPKLTKARKARYSKGFVDRNSLRELVHERTTITVSEKDFKPYPLDKMIMYAERAGIGIPKGKESKL